jgi:hypothetical protein
MYQQEITRTEMVLSQNRFYQKSFDISICNIFFCPLIVHIYITNAVGYILQREVFRLKHDRAAGLF